MGRRSLSTARIREDFNEKLVRDLRRLNFSINKAQFTAQRFEEECVMLVRDMAFSVEASMDHRLKCAVQVVTWARGSVETWHHDKETIDPNATTILGGTVSEAIEQARSAADTFGRLDDLVRRKVPFRDWPADIAALAEAAAFAELDDEDTLVGIIEPPKKT